MERKSSINGQSGSALIWILVCVALFSALTAAVTQMMRGDSQGIGVETSKIYASEILQFSNFAKKSVQEMRMDGFDAAAISFEATMNTGYENTKCTNKNCEVFSPTGGGVAYQVPEDAWLDQKRSGDANYRAWLFPDDTCVQDYPGDDGGDCTGSAGNNDLLLMLEYIDKSVCLEINKQLGIPETSGEPPTTGDGCHSDSKFEGTFNAEHRITHADLDGIPSGCFRQASTCNGATGGYYVFYRVLLGR